MSLSLSDTVLKWLCWRPAKGYDSRQSILYIAPYYEENISRTLYKHFMTVKKTGQIGVTLTVSRTSPATTVISILLSKLQASCSRVTTHLDMTSIIRYLVLSLMSFEVLRIVSTRIISSSRSLTRAKSLKTSDSGRPSSFVVSQKRLQSTWLLNASMVGC